MTAADLRLIDLTKDDYEIARKAVEDQLIELRDSRIGLLRNNGLVVKEKNGDDSYIIRLGIETAMKIGIAAILGHRAAQGDE